MKFNVNANKILEDSEQLDLDKRFESDSISYHHFIKFFKDKNNAELTENDFIVSAYFSYGWMPKILKLNIQNDNELRSAVSLLNSVKQGNFLESSELEFLKKLLNNSIVGTSKLLHFISPYKYLIWDSRVANYFGIKAYKEINSVESYLLYLKFCHKLDKDVVKKVHRNIIKRAPSMVNATELRALEFLFFNKGGKSLDPKDAFDL
jgi:hypothetical protein